MGCIMRNQNNDKVCEHSLIQILISSPKNDNG